MSNHREDLKQLDAHYHALRVRVQGGDRAKFERSASEDNKQIRLVITVTKPESPLDVSEVPEPLEG